MALLNQHDDVYYVIQNDCHVIWVYVPIPMRAYIYTLGNWNWNRAVLQYALKSHDCFESCVLIGLPVFSNMLTQQCQEILPKINSRPSFGRAHVRVWERD